MLRASLLLALAGLAACGESPAPERVVLAPAPAAVTPAPPPPAAARLVLPAAPATVPAAFHGEWNAQLADCGTSRNDSRMQVSADKVLLNDREGPVRYVQEHGETEVSVTIELAGDAETSRVRKRWLLVDDGAALQDDTEGEGLVRLRCGAPAR